MAARTLGFFDYVREAFNWRKRVPLLGHLPLNWAGLAVFAVLGINNPGFWLLGGALETAFLVATASSKRFQHVVQAKELVARQRESEHRLERGIARLGRDSQRRFHALLARCREIAGISETLSEGSIASVTKMRTGGLNQMLWIFLRLLTSREILLESVNATDPEAVEKEIESLRLRVEAADQESSLARSLRSSLEIQTKRLETFRRSEENLEVLDAELDRIEHQVALLREEAAMSGKAEVLTERLDTVTEALTETNRWMEQHAELFTGLEGLRAPDLEDLPGLPPPVPLPEGSGEGAP